MARRVKVRICSGQFSTERGSQASQNASRKRLSLEAWGQIGTWCAWRKNAALGTLPIQEVRRHIYRIRPMCDGHWPKSLRHRICHRQVRLARVFSESSSGAHTHPGIKMGRRPVPAHPHSTWLALIVLTARVEITIASIYCQISQPANPCALAYLDKHQMAALWVRGRKIRTQQHKFVSSISTH